MELPFAKSSLGKLLEGVPDVTVHARIRAATRRKQVPSFMPYHCP